MATHTFELNGFGSNASTPKDLIGPNGKLHQNPDTPQPNTAEQQDLQAQFFEDDEEVRLMNPGVGIGNYAALLEKQEKPKKEASEDIAEFVEAMKGQRQVILAIINRCRTEAFAKDIDEVIEPFKRYRRSVYSDINMRRLLVEHQALQHLEKEALEPVEGVLAKGEEYSVAVDEDGRKVIVDKDGNLIVTKNIIESWVATEAGIAYADAQDPMGELEALLAKEPQYLSIYQRILVFCREKGRTGCEINDIVDNDPLVQDPRRFSQYFLGRLESANALNWEDNWAITDLGLEYLQAHEDELGSVSEELQEARKQAEAAKQAAEESDPYVINEPWEVVDA